MDIVVICVAAFIASGLTLFAGFGLGTLLMPVLALFFPLDLAIALTAIVHLLNNFFKLILMGKHTDKKTLLLFGAPAVLFAFAGAYLLNVLSSSEPLYSYLLFGKTHNIFPLKLVMGMIILLFALFEGLPKFQNITFSSKYIPLGGSLSGFFGGLSGHQGALRSAFLAKSGLSKESFIATGVVIACIVDVTRISVYSGYIFSQGISENITLIILATLSGFAGVFIGSKLLKKVTMKVIQVIISILLFIIGILLITGII
jgi:uncharacterized protein